MATTLLDIGFALAIHFVGKTINTDTNNCAALIIELIDKETGKCHDVRIEVSIMTENQGIVLEEPKFNVKYKVGEYDEKHHIVSTMHEVCNCITVIEKRLHFLNTIDSDLMKHLREQK